MINTAGTFLLLLISWRGGIAIHEMPSFESCQAAIIQLEPIHTVDGYCIAKEVLPDE